MCICVCAWTIFELVCISEKLANQHTHTHQMKYNKVLDIVLACAFAATLQAHARACASVSKNGWMKICVALRETYFMRVRVQQRERERDRLRQLCICAQDNCMYECVCCCIVWLLCIHKCVTKNQYHAYVHISMEVRLKLCKESEININWQYKQILYYGKSLNFPTRTRKNRT